MLQCVTLLLCGTTQQQLLIPALLLVLLLVLMAGDLVYIAIHSAESQFAVASAIRDSTCSFCQWYEASTSLAFHHR